MTRDELRGWLASRRAAGAAIDIETCELGRWYVQILDPYGIREALGEEIYDQVGSDLFVRSPDSRGWIAEEDLPPEKAHALYERIRRESDNSERSRR
jgi:hypothetical protein